MAFKIALTAGHYMNTPGKRCLKSIDPNETREWWLNDRIADKVEKLLRGYTGWELLRTDDTTGKKAISLAERTNAANNWKADFYLSIHHNAGVNGGKGGGIVAYVYTNASGTSVEWQKDLYTALIEATGLKGNRANPLDKANLHECRETKMPAVLLELGFMDSKTDVPIILTEKFADQCAEAIVKVLVKRGGLKPVPKEPTKVMKETAKDSARFFLSPLSGTYTVTASSGLNVRHGAGPAKKKMVAIPKNTTVKCYGYYTNYLGTKWLYIQFTYKGIQYTGFASSKYLKKV